MRAPARARERADSGPSTTAATAPEPAPPAAPAAATGRGRSSKPSRGSRSTSRGVAGPGDADDRDVVTGVAERGRLLQDPGVDRHVVADEHDDPHRPPASECRGDRARPPRPARRSRRGARASPGDVPGPAPPAPAASSSASATRARSSPTTTIEPPESATASTHSVVAAQDEARHAEPGRLALDAARVGQDGRGVELEGERRPVALRLDDADPAAGLDARPPRRQRASPDGARARPADPAARRSPPGSRPRRAIASGLRFSARWTVAKR